MSFLRWFPPVLIDEPALGSAIRDLPRFGVVRYWVETDSTQSRALEILHRLDALGISLVTESQELGHGRAGRAWISPPASGLLVSTILPAALQPASLPAVGFWASLAVADAICEVTGITLGLKWPNDLLLEGRKCAGILSEARTMGGHSRVVVGVGIDVNRPKASPDAMPADAGWLSDAVGGPVDRTALLAAVLRRYEATFDSLIDRPADVISAWWRRAALAGKRVKASSPDGAIAHEGDVLSMDSDGALHIRTSTGDVAVTLGDVDVL